MHGAPPIAGGAGMSVSANKTNSRESWKKRPQGNKSKAHLHAKRAAFALSENGDLVALTNSSCSGHPLLTTPLTFSAFIIFVKITFL
jgi:hypothetical protein